MAKLKIDDIRQDYKNEGWELLSTVYVNLNGDLEAKCPAGHAYCAPYKKWRANKTCPICLKNNVVHIPKTAIHAKKSGVVRVLALDDATKDTGWALYDNKQLVDFGIVRVGGEDPIARIAFIKQWVLKAIEEWEPDLVGIEDIQLQSFYNVKTGKASQNVTLYRTLAHLQGVILVALYEKDMQSTVVHVATWRSYCGISAKKRDEQKKMAQAKVRQWYAVDVSDDIAEAICIGKYLAEKYMRNNTIISWE